MAEGAPGLQQAGADAAPVVPAERFLSDRLPCVVGEYLVVPEGSYESAHTGRGCPWGVVI